MFQMCSQRITENEESSRGPRRAMGKGATSQVVEAGLCKEGFPTPRQTAFTILVQWDNRIAMDQKSSCSMSFIIPFSNQNVYQSYPILLQPVCIGLWGETVLYFEFICLQIQRSHMQTGHTACWLLFIYLFLWDLCITRWEFGVVSLGKS